MKKCGLITAALVAIAIALFGWTNLRHAGEKVVDSAKTWAQELESIDWKLDKAEKKLADIDSALNDTKKKIVRFKVRVEDQDTKVGELVASVGQQWDEIVAMRDAVAEAPEGTAYVTIGDNKHEIAAVKDDLRTRLNRHDAAADNLKVQKEILTSLQAQLRGQEDTYNKLKEARVKKESLIEALKARHELVKAKQVAVGDADNDYADLLQDDADLKQAELAIRELEELTEMDEGEYGRIKVNSEPKKMDILDEIDARKTDKAVDGKASDLINVQ